MKNIHALRVVLFIVILVLLTSFQDVALTTIENQGVKTFLIMWIPGISAILVALFTKLSLKRFGWRISIKWISVGWMLPILYGTIAYSLVWVFGLGDMPNPTFLERVRLTLGMATDSDTFIIVAAFFYITVVCLLPNMLFCLGEELGWRGFLVPELTKWISLKNAGWVSGVIWAFWHFPAIISGAYAVEDVPLWYQIFCFTLLVISTAVILAFLRIKSNSIWPAVVFHAVHNGIIQRFFDRITIDNGLTYLFIGEFGIILATVTSIFAVYYYNCSRKIEPLRFKM